MVGMRENITPPPHQFHIVSAVVPVVVFVATLCYLYCSGDGIIIVGGVSSVESPSSQQQNGNWSSIFRMFFPIPQVQATI